MSSDKSFLISLSIVSIFLFFFFNINIFLYFFVFFFLVSIIKPNLLHLLNYFFYKIGKLVIIFIQPIILRINFFLIFGLISLILKLFKYDPLLLKKNNKLKSSYWITKEKKKINIAESRKQY